MALLPINKTEKVSKSRRGNRRSHDSLNFQTIVECPNCGAEKLPHQVCPSCGFYNKKKIDCVLYTAVRL